MYTDQLIDGHISGALDKLFGEREAATLSRHRVEHVMKQLAHYVRQSETLQTRAHLLTVDDVAKRYDVSYSTVTLWLRRGLIHGAESVGVNPRRSTWLIPEESLNNFTPPAMGRPRKH